jgi:hypothetical protein
LTGGERRVDMSCDCIEKVEEKLRTETGDPKAKIKTGFRFVAGKSIAPDDFIPIAVHYRKKKKDGTFSTKRINHHILGAYCPFCGKKYKEG